MATPYYNWPIPPGTAKPDVVQWLNLLGEAADGTVRQIDDFGRATRTTADAAVTKADNAQATADTAVAKANAAQATANAAKATADAALPKSQRVRAGQFLGMSGDFGTIYIPFPAGFFTDPPYVQVTPVFKIGEQSASTQIYVGDGTSIAAVTKEGAWVGGLPIKALVRVNWMAVQYG